MAHFIQIDDLLVERIAGPWGSISNFDSGLLWASPKADLTHVDVVHARTTSDEGHLLHRIDCAEDIPTSRSRPIAGRTERDRLLWLRHELAVEDAFDGAAFIDADSSGIRSPDPKDLIHIMRLGDLRMSHDGEIVRLTAPLLSRMEPMTFRDAVMISMARKPHAFVHVLRLPRLTVPTSTMRALYTELAGGLQGTGRLIVQCPSSYRCRLSSVEDPIQTRWRPTPNLTSTPLVVSLPPEPACERCEREPCRQGGHCSFWTRNKRCFFCHCRPEHGLGRDAE